MSQDPNLQTNQTPKTINLPDNSGGVEGPLPGGQDNSGGPGEKPGEHVPPLEVPDQTNPQEPVPAKAG